MEGCEHITRLYDLYVRPNGTYHFIEVSSIKHQADFAAFLNALQVLKWRVGR